MDFQVPRREGRFKYQCTGISFAEFITICNEILSLSKVVKHGSQIGLPSQTNRIIR